MNTLRAIVRDFYVNRFYTVINITGLAIGLSCVMLILLYIEDELSFDKYHLNYQRIYRLESELTISGKNQQVAKSSFAIGPYFQKDFPEVEAFVRFRQVDRTYFRSGEKVFLEENVYFADSSVFEVFTFPFVRGEPDKALTEPNSMVVSESFAKKYFGIEDPIGSEIEQGNGLKCMVTGVIRDIPENSHLYFDALVSMTSYPQLIGQETFQDLESRQFWAVRIFTYVLLRNKKDISVIRDKIPAFHDRYIADLSKRFNGTFRILYTRLDRIHLYSHLEWDLPTGDIRNLYIFGSIALFILLMGGINYMNLATARSALKAREVGIRKVVGAHRKQLIYMFLSSSVALSLIALVLGLLLAEIFITLFNELSGKALELSLADHYQVYLIILGATLLIGLLSGSYPAFFLSSFRPTVVLRGVFHAGRQSIFFRKILIVFQFMISIIMITATLVVTRQLQYMKNKEPGYDRDNIMIIPLYDSTAKAMIPALKEELLSNPSVKYVSTSLSYPGHSPYMDIFLTEGSDKMEEQLASLMIVDYDYLDLMGMQIIMGRNFDRNSGTDLKQAVIINQAAVKKLGWEDDPIGKQIHRRSFDPVQCKVIGVVQDFFYNSLHQEVGPMFIFPSDRSGEFLSIKTGPANQKETIQFIEEKWSQFSRKEPFLYRMLADELDDLYQGEERLQRIIGYFALLSIFISLLGLFGLSSFITERNSKNVGIRKIVGASVVSIVGLLSKDFVKLILIALLMAVPIVWYAMEQWLQHFPYRIHFNVLWILLAGAGVLLLAMVTIMVQTIRTAYRNPVEVIKYE